MGGGSESLLQPSWELALSLSLWNTVFSAPQPSAGPVLPLLTAVVQGLLAAGQCFTAASGPTKTKPPPVVGQSSHLASLPTWKPQAPGKLQGARSEPNHSWLQRGREEAPRSSCLSPSLNIWGHSGCAGCT